MCQTWSIWWILQFFSCKSAYLATHILYSLPRPIQSKIPLVLAVCIIQQTRVYDSQGKIVHRLEDFFNYDVFQKLQMLISKARNLSSNQKNFIGKVLNFEIPPLILLMKNTNKSKNYNLQRPWSFPVYCSKTYFAKHPYL